MSEGPPVSILLVDDDDEVRDVLAETLDDLGYRVEQAANGDEALNALGYISDIAVMITDIRMPGMSGLELAERARQLKAGLKVILISGYFQPMPVTQRFLKKPFRARDLADAVQAVLG